ncbi:MAG: hypothetical protein JWR16_88, partial [Nevskia sp.]|nr:hypothetical protein [Nevskia sp.]
QRSPSISTSDLTVNVDTSDGSSYNSATGKLTLKTAKKIVPVTIVVRDANGNPMPSGTTFTLKASSGTILDPATLGPYNINNPSPAANVQGFNFQAPDAAATGTNSGLVSLAVTVPAGACGGATTTTVSLFSFTSP